MPSEPVGEVEGLIELAGRCEKATGPDRELDAKIAPLTGLRFVDEGHPLGRCCYDEHGHRVPLPAYTASLDAAMSLVGDAWWFVERTPCADGYDAEVAEEKSRGATPALALTAAALKARIAMEKE
jgi:hypothetical protein